jgi:hypothetical protein
MRARSHSTHQFVAPRQAALAAPGQGEGKDTLLYVPDDYGLGVEIDPGRLDCRSLVAHTEMLRLRKFAVAAG